MKFNRYLFTFFLLSFVLGQDLVVTTELDTVDANDGLVSLREAVISANAAAGAQTIRFDETVFAPGNNRIIYLKSTLELTDNSGADLSGINAKVTLDGSRIDSSAVHYKDALVLTGGNYSISHLYFRNFLGSAIVIDSLNGGDNQIGPGNHISKCRGAGIKVIYSENNIITGNDVWNCGADTLVMDDYRFDKQDGIMLLVNADNNNITGNNCWANYGAGLGSFRSANNSFSNNYIAVNNQYGIAVYEGNGGNTISENDLLANGAIGILLFGINNNNNQIRNNNFGDETAVAQIILANRLSPEKGAPKENLKTRIAYKINTGDAISSLQEAVAGSQLSDNTTINPGFITKASAIDIELMGTSDIYISDNDFTSTADFGIFIEGMQYIDSSDVEPDTTYAFPANITIENNRFERMGNFCIYFSDVHDIAIKDNYFHSVYSAIFGGGIISFDPRKAGLDSTDRGTFNIVNNLISGNLSSSFGIYISAAELIKIENNEIETFPLGVYLIAADYLHVVKNNIRETQSMAIHVIQPKTCIIRDNQLQDNKQFGIYVGGSGKAGQQESAEIVSNRILSTGIYGIFAAALPSLNVTSNQVEYVYQGFGIFINGIGHANVDSNQVQQSMSTGFLAADLDTLLMQKNIIKNQTQAPNVQLSAIKLAELHQNKLLSGSFGGLMVSAVDSLRITGNEFRDSGQMGAAINNGWYTLLRDNDFSGNIVDGLSINTVARVEMKENTIIANANGASLSGIKELQFHHNNIYENNETGLLLTADTLVICDSNYIALNKNGAVVVSFDSLEMHYNSFINNIIYGVRNEAADSIDARMNYWGHAEGPTVGDSLYPGSRLGDKTGGMVIYKPFLTTPAVTSSIKPEITSIEPNESEEAGGATAELLGYNFMPDLTVLFGNDTVYQVTYISLTRLKLVIPPGKGGYRDVIIINPNGQTDTLANGFYYIPQEPLVIKEPGLPLHYSLHQNYPNPFNPSTTIRYDIVNPTHVELSIYTITGQKVATLINQQQAPGRYAIEWNAKNMASGLYFYTIKSEHFTKTRKLILLK